MIELIEIFLIAFTVFSESLHESITDKVDVASVIYNRASDKQFDYVYVITKPKQFSCHNTFASIRDNSNKIQHRKFEWFISLIIARNMYYGIIQPTVKARHYATIETKCVWMKDMIIEKMNRRHKYLVEEK